MKGSTFESFLEEAGIKEEVYSEAAKRIAEELKARGINPDDILYEVMKEAIDEEKARQTPEEGK